MTGTSVELPLVSANSLKGAEGAGLLYRLALVKTQTLDCAKEEFATVNMFMFTAIQSLLKPTLVKSAHVALFASASTLKRFQRPVGSLVWETPISNAEAVEPPLAPAAEIHQMPYGS